MSHSRVLVGFVVLAGLITSSCGSGSTSTPSPSSDASTTVAAPNPTVDEPDEVVDADQDEDADEADRPDEVDEAAAVVEEALAAFDPDDIDEAVATARDLDRRADLALADLEGITDELGGPDAAAAAFADADAGFAGLTEPLQKPSVFGLRSPQQAVPSIGGGIFGGFMVIALGSESLISGSNDGSTGTRSIAEGVTATASADSVDLAMDVTHVGDGLTTTLKTTVKIFPCPDPNGQFVVQASIDTTSTVTGGSRSQRGTLDVKVTGHVNDDARLVSDTSEFRLKRTGLGWGSFVDTSVRLSYEGTDVTGGSSTLEDFNWFTSTPEQMKDNALLATLFGLMVKRYLLDAAVAGFQSGRCVEIAYGVSPGTSGLTPSSTASITARPRARQDGAPTGGTVSAVLASGDQLVDPASTPIPADAEFVYTASDMLGDTATVALEARSRRGVGKVDIVFTTGASYVASGSSEGVTFTGTVESLNAPFAIDISFPGSESGSFAFDGSTETGGGVVVDAEGGGAILSGAGTYTVGDNDDGTKTLTATVSTCVDVSNQCRSSVHPILLTPAT